MRAGDGLTIARWLHAADGRPCDDIADRAWTDLLEGVEVEDAIDVIVDHYRDSSDMLPACDLLSRATVLGLLRQCTTTPPPATPATRED